MSISQAEIDFGKVAIARRLATQDQIRECVAIQSRLAQPLHLGAILVKKGYMNERDARDLLAQVERGGSNGSGYGVGSAYGAPSGSGRPGPATAPANGSGTGGHVALAAPPSPYPGASMAVCSACGARFPVTAAQVGQRFRCRGCGATVVAAGAGGAAPAYPGANVDPDGSNYPRHPQPGQNGHGTDPVIRAGANLHGTQLVQPGQIQPRYNALDGMSSSENGGVKIDDDSVADTKGSAELAEASSPHLPVGGTAVSANGIASNLAADDPIAHVMEARHGADGAVETVFGPYDILGEIARGGMGIVYRARQRDLKRIVALKVMKEGEGASKKQIKRFQRETETAAKLQHPNIVAVHEVGCHQGFHYFTMDLIEGDALDEVVKRGEKMPLERVLQIVEEVARAIHYAHGKGIIHRDLKPANILLDTDGHPKVTDFGLAKSIDHKSMLTRTGAVVGTPFYMPPEQAKGENDIDQRADVYALGVILYELLTLKLPFHGETTMEVYRKILEDDPLPPRHHDSKVPMDIQTICLKAMDREPSRRYQTSKDLADDIQRYLQGEPISARPLNFIQKIVRRARKNLPVVAVALVTFLALTSAVGVFVWKYKKSIDDAARAATEREWNQLGLDLENLKLNVKSQWSSAMNRMKDHDPNGALADLREGVRLLDDLPKLSQDFKWNPRSRADTLLTEQKPEINGLYRDGLRLQGDAWQMRETPEAFDEALNAYKKALEYDGTSKDALDVHLAIGKVLARKGLFEEALKVFASILEKDKTHVKALIERGSVYDLRQEHRRAIEDYTRVIDKELESNEAHLRRGGSYFELHLYEEAKKDFEYVIEHKDSDWNAYIWRGRVRAALGDTSGATDDLTEAIDLQPSYPDGYFYRAELYFELRKHAEAIKDYEVAITRSAQYYKAYTGLGRVLEWTLDYDRAAQQYEEVLKGEDREAEAEKPRALAAKAHLIALRGVRSEVLAETEQKMRDEKSDKNGTLGPPPPLQELTARADTEQKKHEKQARDLYDEALKGSPKLLPALIGRARLSLIQSDMKAAQDDLETALATLADRAWVKDRKEQSAERGPSDASGADGELAEVESLLGHAALLATRANPKPDVSSAIKHFEAALAADKDCAMATGGLGVAYALRAGTSSTSPDAATARTYFKKARALEGANLNAADPSKDDGKLQSEELFFQSEGLKHAQNADRSKKPEYYVQARQSFARAISQDPYHALAYLERGRLAGLWKFWDLAVEDATSSAEADPYLREAYELRGFLFGRDLPEQRNERTQRPKVLRDRTKAVADLTQAIAVAEAQETTPQGRLEAAAEARFGRALARTGLYAPSAVPAAPAAPPSGTAPGTPPGDAPAPEPVAPASAPAPDADALDKGLADVKDAIASIPAELPKWMDDERTSTDRISAAADFHELAKRILTAQGQADLAKGEGDKAEEVRQQAREAARKAHEAGKGLRDRRNYSDAIAKFDRAIALNPEHSEAFYDRGTCYLKIGNFVPGILDFSRALELNPRFADQFYNKVYQVSYVVDLNRVITELNKIVADHPDVSYVIFLRGFFYVAKTEFKKFDKSDLDSGIRDFDRTLQLNPKHVSAFIYRGFLYYKGATIAPKEEKQKLFDRAMEDYDAAITRDPESGISHFLKAMCWSVQSQEATAPEEKAKLVDTAIEELRISINEKQFKGFDRIKNEPRVLQLMQGK